MQLSIIQIVFDNYEIAKLPIALPSINNLLIYLIILLIAIISVIKEKSNFLDTSQTDQLKGIAILFIVISHLWFHVSKYRAIPMLGDYSVTLFLMLSGFGLTRSLSKRPLLFYDFISRRLKKVLVPYWLITIIILILDYIILDRQYSLKNIVLTLAGINLNQILRQLDYARWFITLLLIYYVVFFIANKLFNKLQAIILLSGFGIMLLLLKHYGIFYIGKYNQMIAFPLGCIISYYYEDISLLIYNLRTIKLFILLISFTIITINIPLLLFNDKSSYVYNIGELLVYNINGLLFCVLLMLSVALIGVNNYVSRLLIFCGTISYEIYLIHGPLLIKYNPFFSLMPVSLIVVSFLVYLSFIILISYWFSKMTRLLIASNPVNASLGKQ